MSEWAKSYQIQIGEDLAGLESPNVVDVVANGKQLNISLPLAEIALHIVQHFCACNSYIRSAKEGRAGSA